MRCQKEWLAPSTTLPPKLARDIRRTVYINTSRCQRFISNTTAAQIEYACVRHCLPQVDGNEYEAKNNEPCEICESGTKKSGPYTVTVLLKIFAQVSKTRRIPDRSGKDRRCMSVSQSQTSS